MDTRHDVAHKGILTDFLYRSRGFGNLDAGYKILAWYSMKTHLCKELDSCICHTGYLEPEDNCPFHGGGIYPKRCIICGRFMKLTKNQGGRNETND